MILKPQLEFWTAEEKAEYNRLMAEGDYCLQQLRAVMEKRPDTPEADVEKSCIHKQGANCFWRAAGIEADVYARYRAKRGPDGLMDDVRAIVAAVDRGEDKEFYDEWRRDKFFGEDSARVFAMFIMSCLSVQLTALRDDAEKVNQIETLVNERAEACYLLPAEPIIATRATNTLVYLDKRCARPGRWKDGNGKTKHGQIIKNGELVVKFADPVEGRKAEADRLKEIEANPEKVKLQGIYSYTPTADKFLRYALIELAKVIDRAESDPTGEPTQEHVSVYLSQSGYGKIRGKDVEERETSTPDESKAEENRLRSVNNSLCREINAAGTILMNMYMTYDGMKGRYIDKIDIQDRRDMVIVRFSPEAIAYIRGSKKISYCGLEIFKLDGRNEAAYWMMVKMNEHFYNEGNEKRGTHSRLKVETLLNVAKLNAKDDSQAMKRWRSRIKGAFEKALDSLCADSALRYWHYCNAKGADLTADQADRMAAGSMPFMEWVKLYVEFQPANPARTAAEIERLQIEAKARSEAAKQGVLDAVRKDAEKEELKRLKKKRKAAKADDD